MNETKQIKFPIAAVFCTLNVLLVLLGFINIFMTYALLQRMPLDRLLVSLLLPGLSLISGIVLAVILYNRKRNLPLFLALGLELAICLFCIYGTVSEQSLMNSYWGRVRLFSQAITAVNALLFLVFAVSQDRKEESDMAKFLRKIWFIPGILYLAGNLSDLNQGYLVIINHAQGYGRIMLMMFSILAVELPMTFLLGWWLTHPYKKERSVYQMPVAQPYGQPVYQSVGVSDAAQKVFCTGCGRELPPDEDFCGACGTKRPTIKGSDHTEQGNHIEL